MRLHRHMAGFTLLEAIMVIVITAVLGGMMASLAKPLQGYFDATRRADISDEADTALRRIARELHTALPNSVLLPNNQFLEFLPTITGGRYRAAQDCSGTCTGDILDFSQTDTSFDVIGTLSAVPAAGNELVVYNLGVTGASVYTGDNVATISNASCSNSATRVCFSAVKFPFESPAARFQIIDKPVTFACDSTTSTLWRYSYPRPSSSSSQPSTIAALNSLAGVSKARLATNVDCAASSFIYTSGVTQRSGLISLRLKITSGSESVTLLHQVQVPNVP